LEAAARLLTSKEKPKRETKALLGESEVLIASTIRLRAKTPRQPEPKRLRAPNQALGNGQAGDAPSWPPIKQDHIGVVDGQRLDLKLLPPLSHGHATVVDHRRLGAQPDLVPQSPSAVAIVIVVEPAKGLFGQGADPLPYLARDDMTGSGNPRYRQGLVLGKVRTEEESGAPAVREQVVEA
jgi:hypothetical protein